MSIIEILLICLLITVAVEVLLALLLGYRRVDLVYIILANVITNPLLNTTINYVEITVGKTGRLITLIIGEILAVLIEGTIYKKYIKNNKLNPYVLSLILNLITLGIGLVLDMYVW